LKEFKLKINEDHAKIILNALDLYSRVIMMQFEHVANVVRWTTIDVEKEEWNDKLTQLTDIMTYAKTVLGHPENGSYGIRSPEISDQARQAYDILQVIRHVRSWAMKNKDPKLDKRESSMFGVGFDDPMFTSVDKDFVPPTMELINPVEEKLENL
jgi:hypothetical protein